MCQVGGDLNLTHEPLDAEAGSEFGTKHLDGYLTAMLEVLGIE
jgi:hypothetical protein